VPIASDPPPEEGIGWAIAAGLLCLALHQRAGRVARRRIVSIVLDVGEVEAMLRVLATARSQMEPRLTVADILRGLHRLAPER